MQGIECRGKLKHNSPDRDGRWIYGFYVLTQSGCHQIYQHNDIVKSIYPETVGLDTSRVDIKQQKIYGGDIVKDEHGNVGEVFWEEAMLAWRISYTLGYAWLAHETQLEVIGNIYDDPKLLKEGA